MTDAEQTHTKEANDTFESIYRTHYSRLYTLAFRMTGTPENAEDVLQTSFLEAYKGFPRFRFESTPYTWLYRIVLNAARKQLLKWERMPMDRYAEEHGIGLGAAYAHVNSYGQVEDEALIGRVRETCLQMFMNCMPAKYRSVYTLRGMLQLSVKETADVLEISEDAVKANLHRARKIAKDHMEGKCSLIKAGALCDCRAFAAYIKRRNRESRLQNIEVVKRKEAEAVERYTAEMAILLEIDKLYATELSSVDYDTFKTRLKELRKEGQLTLLER